jgi:hypothetical protein
MAGHIFFTTTGPKALDPKVAHMENHGINVTKLRIGDAVYRLNPECTACIEVPICSISYERAQCTTVHGLHFARGGNGGRYFANGYWVGENYPDITIQGLLRRFASLTAHEQQAFAKSVRELPHTFRSVFGNVVFDAFQRAFSHPVNAMTLRQPRSQTSLTAVEHAAANDVSIKQLVATFRLVSAAHLADRKPFLDSTHPRYERTIDHINEGIKLPTITIANGSVLCDGKPADGATMSHLSIRWRRQVPETTGRYEYGALRLVAHGSAVVGVLGQGHHAIKDMRDLEHTHNFFALADANDYEMVARPQWSISPGAADEESYSGEDSWSPFWKIRVGLARHDGGVVLRVTLPDLDDEYESRYANNDMLAAIYSLTPVNLDPYRKMLKFSVKVTPGMEQTLQDCIRSWTGTDPPGPAFGSCTFSLNLQSNEIHGHYREIVDDEVGNFTEGPIHALYCVHSDTVEATYATSLLCAKEQKQHGQTDHTATVHDPSKLYHSAAPPATRELLPTLFESSALSVAELQTMSGPDLGQLFHLAHTYLEQAAAYWRAGPETNLLGHQKKTARHVAPASLTESIDAECRVFLAEFERALTFLSLAHSPTFCNVFSDQDRMALRYYWQGSSKGCLSQNPTFNKLWRIAIAEAFTALTPTLRPYLADAHDWAQDLFHLVSDEAELTAQAFAMFQTPTTIPTTRYCAILSALDSGSRDFEGRLWRLVRNKLLMRSAAGTIATDAIDWCGFATTFTQLLIDRLEGGPKDHISAQLSIDLKELITVMFTSSAEDLAGAMFGSNSPLGQCFVTALRQTDDVAARNGLANFPTVMSNFFRVVDRNCAIFAKAKPHLTSFCALA